MIFNLKSFNTPVYYVLIMKLLIILLKNFLSEGQLQKWSDQIQVRWRLWTTHFLWIHFMSNWRDKKSRWFDGLCYLIISDVFAARVIRRISMKLIDMNIVWARTIYERQPQKTTSSSPFINSLITLMLLTIFPFAVTTYINYCSQPIFC